MNPIYTSGDVVFFQNIKLFNAPNEFVLDTRINGHPFIILEDVNEFGEYASCLLCSSSKKFKEDKNRYLIEKLALHNHLPKDTYVDFKHIYKIKITGIIPVKGHISKELLKELKELAYEELG